MLEGFALDNELLVLEYTCRLVRDAKSTEPPESFRLSPNAYKAVGAKAAMPPDKRFTRRRSMKIKMVSKDCMTAAPRSCLERAF